MDPDYLPCILRGSAIASIMVLLGYTACRHHKRKSLPYRSRPRSCGPGAVGAFWDLLNEDQRHTVEIIVEQRAEERRPEYPDGKPPETKPEIGPKF